MESNNSKFVPYAIAKKKEDAKQSCLELLSYMKDFIPKTINDANNINDLTNVIERPFLGDPKFFNTECTEFLQYINEVNNENKGVHINVGSYNVSYVNRSIDWENERINYNLWSGT
jgi:hypothetical protein